MGSKNFDACLARLLAHEGGYGNHPSDPGGPTNFGITLGDYRRYVKPDATAADVRGMQVAEARAIYRAHYWDALACDDLPGGVDYALFDYGVNSGIARAAQVLRHLLGLPAANNLTPPVIAAAALCDARRLVAAICDERLAFLQSLKTWPVFGVGWGRRVAEVRAFALALASPTTLGGATVPPVKRPEAARPDSAPGKGIVPARKAAQHATAGAIIAAGLAAAHRLYLSAFGSVVLVIAVSAATLTLAAAVWLWWRRRRRLQQITPIVRGDSR